MHALDVLGDPVRRRLVELLAEQDRTAGELVEAVQAERAISQPAVSQHLRVLRENGLAASRADGRTRVYSLRPEGLREVDAWVDRYRSLWAQRLDALGTEVSRGRRAR